MAIVLLAGRTFLDPVRLGILFRDRTLQRPFGASVVFSSALAFHLMNQERPKVRPATAGIVYCLEPVFAILCPALLGGEGLRGGLSAGGGLILTAILPVTIRTRREAAPEG
jgi:drug/metabolite transporter (DMT)-like permease